MLLVKLDSFLTAVVINGRIETDSGKRRKLWLLAEFGVNACL